MNPCFPQDRLGWSSMFLASAWLNLDYCGIENQWVEDLCLFYCLCVCLLSLSLSLAHYPLIVSYNSVLFCLFLSVRFKSISKTTFGNKANTGHLYEKVFFKTSTPSQICPHHQLLSLLRTVCIYSYKKDFLFLFSPLS